MFVTTFILNIFKKSISGEETKIELKEFHSGDIPLLQPHNDFQRYGFIELPDNIDIKTFKVTAFRPIYFFKAGIERLEVAGTNEEVWNKMDGKELLQEKGTAFYKDKRACYKYDILLAKRETPFKVERNDCELPLQYYNGPVSDLELENEQKQAVISHLKHKNVRNFIIISIEWFNFLRLELRPVYYKIKITDTKENVYFTDLFYVINSLENGYDLYLFDLYGYKDGFVFADIISSIVLQKKLSNKMFPVTPAAAETFEYRISTLPIDEKEFICMRHLVENVELKSLWKGVYREIYLAIICVSVPLGLYIFLTRDTKIMSGDRWRRESGRNV